MGMTEKTIDLTPTWREIVPTLVMVAHEATDKKSRDFAMGELLKLADIVDRHIASLKTLREEELHTVCGDCGCGNGKHMFGCPEASNAWMKIPGGGIECAGCGRIGDCTCDDVTCDKCESVNLPNCGEEGCPMLFGVDDDSIKAGEE